MWSLEYPASQTSWEASKTSNWVAGIDSRRIFCQARSASQFGVWSRHITARVRYGPRRNNRTFNWWHSCVHSTERCTKEPPPLSQTKTSCCAAGTWRTSRQCLAQSKTNWEKRSAVQDAFSLAATFAAGQTLLHDFMKLLPCRITFGGAHVPIQRHKRQQRYMAPWSRRHICRDLAQCFGRSCSMKLDLTICWLQALFVAGPKSSACSFSQEAVSQKANFLQQRFLNRKTLKVQTGPATSWWTLDISQYQGLSRHKQTENEKISERVSTGSQAIVEAWNSSRRAASGNFAFHCKKRPVSDAPLLGVVLFHPCFEIQPHFLKRPCPPGRAAGYKQELGNIVWWANLENASLFQWCTLNWGMV